MPVRKAIPFSGSALSAILVAAAMSSSHAAAPLAADFGKAVQPFFEQHCLDCHDAKDKKGGLDLETLKPSFANRDECAEWTLIFDRIERGEMPPPKKSRPPEAAKKAAMQWIGLSIFDAESKRQAAQGRTAWRRLSRAEYQNTIHDLLLVDVDVKSMLPEDALAGGFDNIGRALELSPIHMEKYLEAADAALDVLLKPGPKPETKSARHTFLDSKNGVSKSEQILKLPDAAVFTNELYPPKTLSTFRAPSAGRYRFRASVYAYQSDKPLPVMIYAGSQDTRHGKTELTQAFDAPPRQPIVHEWTEQLDRNDTIRIVTKGPAKEWGKSANDYGGPGLAVQWVEVEGPAVPEWPPAGYKHLLGDVDLTKGTAEDLQKILRAFLPRAFRRPVSDAEAQPFLALARAKLDAGVKFEEALRFGLKTVLVAPQFLYLQAAPGKLDDYALASRLSYFLWSSAPDDTLLDLAAKKQLSQPAILRTQTERLLADPRAKAFTDNFTGQWLKLRDIRATMPDKKLYPEFDELLEWSMVQETHAFFDELLHRDLSILNFVQSDFAMLNSRLAEHYGIPGVDGLQFRKVPLKPEWHRGGVLTQAAILKVTANGTNTSPVPRGVFVLDRILGRPVPPPPKNIPAVEPDTRGAETIRAQLEKHRTVELCATCHTRIDPPGAALESFDVIGGLRERYRIVPADYNQRAKGPDGKRLSYGYAQPVETDATLPDGRSFKTLDELKTLLLADAASRDQVARALTEKLITYATGQELGFADRATVSGIVSRIRPKNYPLRTLLHEVIQSPLFTQK